MNTQRLIFSCLLLLAATPSFAEKDYKYGKITARDFETANEESASAVILCDIGSQSFDLIRGSFVRIFTRHVRIHVLTREGYPMANCGIQYMSRNGMESVLDIDAKCHWLEGGAVQSQKMDNKLVFDEKVNDLFFRKKFTIPGVREGCIIEYRYEIRTYNAFHLSDWVFQSTVPVKYSEITNLIPDYFTYERTIQHPEHVTEQQMPGMVRSLGSGAIITATFRETKYSATDLPALEEENYVSTMNNYFISVHFFLTNVKWPIGYAGSFNATWMYMMELLSKSEDFGLAYTGTNPVDKLIPPVPDSLSYSQKVEFAYRFVTRAVEWNGQRLFFAPNNLKTVMERGKGGSGEINLLLLRMLRNAGVEAVPVLIRTRDQGYVRMDDINLNQFNHVIVRVKTEKGTAFLDATDGKRPSTLLDEDDMNGLGLVATFPKPEWVRINGQDGSQNTFLANCKLKTDGTLELLVNTSDQGYAAHANRKHLVEDKDYFKSRLVEKVPDADISEYSVTHADTIALPLKMKYAYSTKNFARIEGDSIFLTPSAHFGLVENPFTRETRKLPLEFPHTFTENGYINVEIPENYTVASLPESATITLEGGGMTFTFFAAQNGNVVQLRYNFILQRNYFEPAAYAKIRELYAQRMAMLAEEIVLARK